ncbi:MAG: tRNA isopentenyl-2-thiomethyl-A-37 hydroxylase MiaE [Candidatus Margulisiibacteriota bacterium]
MTQYTITELPLKLKTPLKWAEAAITEPLELLNDHAHLEKKAATNAMDMLNRWPTSSPPNSWIANMIHVAKDEVEHLQVVNKILERRGGLMSKSHKNNYATLLNGLIRMGQGHSEHVDRLLVSALIECRSCERFAMLAKVTESKDSELNYLYSELWRSEHGHYAVFLEMAKLITSESVPNRWEWFLDHESQIMMAQPFSYTMHSFI